MSRDQKPGRIRVVSSGRMPLPAGPAGDAGTASEAGSDAAQSAVADAAPARARGWTGALLFIGGCAVGGAGFTALLRGF